MGEVLLVRLCCCGCCCFWVLLFWDWLHLIKCGVVMFRGVAISRGLLFLRWCCVAGVVVSGMLFFWSAAFG